MLRPCGLPQQQAHLTRYEILDVLHEHSLLLRQHFHFNRVHSDQITEAQVGGVAQVNDRQPCTNIS